MESVLSRPTFREILHHPNYSKLLLGQTIAACGDRINQSALLSIFIYHTGSVAKHGADITFWTILSSVILGPFAMALIDRWDRQRVMILSDAGRGILVFGMPIFLAIFDHHYVMYSIMFLMGIFSALFAPCRLAFLPNLDRSDRLLMSANAMTSQAGTIASILALPIGGFLVEHLGSTPCFWLNSLTYLTSAFFIYRLKPISIARPLQRHPVEDFLEGLDYIKKHSHVLFSVVFFGLLQCLIAVFFPCFLSYGVDVLGQTVGGTNVLFATMGIGMLMGALCLAAWPTLGEEFGNTSLSLCGVGIGLFCLSFTFIPQLAAFFLFFLGIAAGMILIPMDTFLQRYVPDSVRGRVFVVRGFLVGCIFLVSLQFSKWIIYQWGALKTFQFLGCFAIALGVLGYWVHGRWSVPSLCHGVQSTQPE